MLGWDVCLPARPGDAAQRARVVFLLWLRRGTQERLYPTLVPADSPESFLAVATVQKSVPGMALKPSSLQILSGATGGSGFLTRPGFLALPQGISSPRQMSIARSRGGQRWKSDVDRTARRCSKMLRMARGPNPYPLSCPIFEWESLSSPPLLPCLNKDSVSQSVYNVEPGGLGCHIVTFAY